MIFETGMAISEAAKLLGFTDHASLIEIKKKYYEMVKEWHPDVSAHDPDISHEMIILYKKAYDTLLEYCLNFPVPLKDEKNFYSTGSRSTEYWKEHFGDDPIWG